MVLMLLPDAKEVCERYTKEPVGVDVKDLAIHRRSSRVNYSRRCAEAWAVKAYQKRGISLAPGMDMWLRMPKSGMWILKEIWAIWVIPAIIRVG